MVFLDKRVEEKIKLAKSCQDIKKQRELASSCNINVRRALAKNPFLETEIANFLVFDPSVNVSYYANINSNCTIKRSFSKEVLNNHCITCDFDELSINCETCTK